jgi:hypothetical protein
VTSGSSSILHVRANTCLPLAPLLCIVRLQMGFMMGMRRMGLGLWVRRWVETVCEDNTGKSLRSLGVRRCERGDLFKRAFPAPMLSFHPSTWPSTFDSFASLRSARRISCIVHGDDGQLMAT